jgi:hypothetical protein
MRSAIVRTLPLAALLVGSLAACGHDPAAPAPFRVPSGATAIPTQPLAEAIAPQGYGSTFTTRQRIVVRDAAAWAALWPRLVGNQTPVPPVPAVDFSRSMIILAAMGTKPSSGYAITIDAVFQSGGTTYAGVRETSPADDCLVLTVITSPIDAVLVPRSDAPVIFRERAETHHC